MSEIQAMRTRVKETYSGSLSWSDKVDKMSDKQVLAIYRRFTAEGKIK